MVGVDDRNDKKAKSKDSRDNRIIKEINELKKLVHDKLCGIDDGPLNWILLLE